MTDESSENPPTREEVETIKARAERATKGPLHSKEDGVIHSDCGKIVLYCYARSTCGRSGDFYECRAHQASATLKLLPEDRELLLHARTDIITLCDWVLSLLPPPAPERKDDWIPWSGDGPCPVSARTLTEAKLRSGRIILEASPHKLDWSHGGVRDSGGDIIAYRPVPAEGER